MIRVVALVKYTPDMTGTRAFAGDHTVDRSTECRLSELDEHTAEQAVQITESAEAELTYLTMGPPDAKDALRKALSMGGDRAVHVCDDALHGSDAWVTSRVLATALRTLTYDLVLCGMASTDAGMGVMPSMLAERLGLPQISLAASLRLDGDKIHISREGAYATETIDGTLPALVSVTDRTGEARYPSFKGIMAAKKKPIDTLTLADLGIDPSTVGLGASYTQVLSVTPRPPRQSGEIVTDDGDGGRRLADFLGEHRFI